MPIDHSAKRPINVLLFMEDGTSQQISGQAKRPDFWARSGLFPLDYLALLLGYLRDIPCADLIAAHDRVRRFHIITVSINCPVPG